MALSLVTAPTVEPLTIAELKSRLRIDVADEDAVVEGLIKAARHRAERVTGRQLVAATWEDRRDTFPCEYEIQLPKPPLISVVSITYIDTAGAPQVWGSSNYEVDSPAGPTARFGRIQPAYATNWPATRTDTFNALVVRFIAGYGQTGPAVPEDIRAAIALIVKSLYDDDAVALTRALALLTPYKVYE